MSTTTWRPVGAVDPRALGEARRQAHNAAQWLARIAASYCPVPAGDERLRLGYETAEHVIATPTFSAAISLVLDVGDLVMQFRESGRRVSHRIALDGRSPAEAEAWILVELLHRGVDRSHFTKVLPYGIAQPMSGDGVWYRQDAHAPALTELANWLANGASLIAALGGAAEAPAQASGRLEFYPHPFVIERQVGPASGQGAPMVRVGLSAGDERRGEPYFFVGGASGAKDAVLPMGRVITASEVLAAGGGANWLALRLGDAVAEARARQLN